MNIELDLMQVAGAVAGLIAFGLGGIFGVVKLLLVQFQRRLDDRFAAQDLARAEGSKLLRDAIARQGDAATGLAAQVASLERDFLTHRAELPLQYVRREDYIRGQTVIEAKLDALGSKLEVLQIKGAARND